MGAPSVIRMRADEFIAWAMDRPDGGRHELVAGEVMAMSPERAVHAETKFAVTASLKAGIAERRLECQAFIDGLSVRIDEGTVYEPDALVRCGARIAGDTVEIDDPVIVVEVVSPSSRALDTGGKLEDYFRLPSVRHYLIVRTATRSVIHHRRDQDGRIQTRVLSGGALELEPPGITVAVESFFG